MNDKQKYLLESHQSIINRVENNCFSIKSLTITIVSASIAFVASVESNQTLLIGTVSMLVLIFWHLDARYLREGRRFRNIHNQIAKEADLISPDDVDKSINLRLVAIMFSWSVAWFYGALLALLIAVLAVLASTTGS